MESPAAKADDVRRGVDERRHDDAALGVNDLRVVAYLPQRLPPLPTSTIFVPPLATAPRS